MPKKQPKNAFYYYMLDYRAEQKQKGITYNNLAEVSAEAGVLWPKLPPSIRNKYEKQAKEVKEKMNIPLHKFTSTGIPYAEIERKQQEERDAERKERKDIENMIKLRSLDGKIQCQDFYLMDVNYYCQVESDYVICEMTILKFNLVDGVIQEYHEIVNPGKIPTGYASDARNMCQEIGMQMPDLDTQSDYMKILANLMDVLNVEEIGSAQPALPPPIFTMPKKIAPVQSFLQQLGDGDNCIFFRVYHLDYMFFTLINSLRVDTNEGFPKESLALVQLEKDLFKFSAGTNCEQHSEDLDKRFECTTSRVRRWAYTILDHCCPLRAIELVPGRHLPEDCDLQKVHQFQESNKPLHHNNSGYEHDVEDSDTSSFDAGWRTVGVAANRKVKEAPKRPPRRPAAVRLPVIDFSDSEVRTVGDAMASGSQLSFAAVSRGRGNSTKVVAANQDEEVPKRPARRVPTEVRLPITDFSEIHTVGDAMASGSQLSIGGAGRGRGRDITRDLSKMKVGK